MNIFGLLFSNLSSKAVTLRFPERPAVAPGYRGLVIYDPEKCTGCGMCAFRCTSRAIDFRNSRTQYTWSYEPGQCTYCGRCVDGCEDHALSQEEQCPPIYFHPGELKVTHTSARKEKKPKTVEGGA